MVFFKDITFKSSKQDGNYWDLSIANAYFLYTLKNARHQHTSTDSTLTLIWNRYIPFVIYLSDVEYFFHKKYLQF